MTVKIHVADQHVLFRTIALINAFITKVQKSNSSLLPQYNKTDMGKTPFTVSQTAYIT